MTTLIGCRCKSGNIFSQALLIGRGLFLIEICKQISKGYRWKRKLVSYVISSVLANRIRWWQIVRIPPVPIPNTVVKTYRGENTWRATAWKDSSLPASKLNKSEITWTSSFAFLFENIYPLMDFNFRFFYLKKFCPLLWLSSSLFLLINWVVRLPCYLPIPAFPK